MENMDIDVLVRWFKGHPFSFLYTKLPFSILHIQKNLPKTTHRMAFLLIAMASYFHKTTRWQQMLLVSWVDSFLKGSLKFCRKSFQNK